jgi:hypothetical protein
MTMRCIRWGRKLYVMVMRYFTPTRRTYSRLVGGAGGT